jgi:trimeric autotransporter adhesin
MKTKLLLSTLLSFIFCLLSSQVPQGFNYQAIARDGSGNPITGQTIDVKLAILSDTITPVVVREELFSSVKTNSFGMFTLVLGTGTYQAGSVTNFPDIDWVTKPLFMRIQVNYKSAWRNMGSAKLWSVPYSLIAKDLGGSLKKLKVTGSETSMDSALFEVKNRTGQTVFAVYNEGVRVYVDDGVAKGATKGGFAIGSFGSDKAPSKSYFVVNADSIRAYIAPNTGKGTKGGFAIGGFDAAKTAAGEQYLRVTRDSTRIYVDDNVTKGTKGGFAIGGFNGTKGTTDNFMQLTQQNYFIGHNSGKNITTGLYNSFLGYMSGFKNTTGSSNTFFGDSTGFNNTTGSWNVFIGKQAGYSNVESVSNVFIGNGAGQMATNTAQSDASYNVAIGTLAGYYNTGRANCFVGQEAGFTNQGGRYNVFLGIHSGQLNDTANYNVFLGSNTGYNNMGDANVFIGNYAGNSNLGASYNVFVGNNAGTLTTSGEKNVILGSDAGYENTTGTINTFLGNLTGNSNISGKCNLFAGDEAGFSNISGNYNTYLGTVAGANATGSNNTAVGNAAGKSITSDYNTMVGFQTGYNTKTGSGNAFFGHQAGHENISGTYNTYIGPSAGYFNTTGSNNVMIGYNAGCYEYGSNKLVIDNTNSYIPSSGALIYGDFSTDQLRFNAYVGINSAPSSTYRLYVSGSVYSTVGFYYPSDIRLKKNIRSMDGDGVIDKVKDMKVIKYNYTNEITKGDTLPDRKYIGVVAQDIEKSFPEAVRTDENGYKAVNLNALTAILLQAVKDQQKQIESAKQENQNLKAELDELKVRVNSLLDK